ncbi:hypothetical protein GCM10027598_13800 [Amycolatopsis oliviviridis]|uniref:Uncharacterized protein n=1 Tax=Amycolatopsis oliviviridis TaxID=1471590 RepID=A0ABQ3LTR0_9PSEU|nr:hypothetical protein [Amycolatopsis oliviviridis]GHH25912.1 hypothetical protein GCM10017790_52340 [Amycolatopsis oliviviridis]
MIKYRSALVMACGVVLAVPAVAYAQDVSTSPTTSATPPPVPYPFIAVSPAKSKAGEDVLVSVGCAVAELGEVKSMVLDSVGKFEVTSENPVIQGAVAHVNDKARPGFYAVTAVCKTKAVTINIEVTAVPTSSVKPPKPTASPSKPAPPGAAIKPGSGRQVSKIPVGAPQTGGGAFS